MTVTSAEKEVVSQFQLDGDKLVLSGAIHDALKAAPDFEYANQKGRRKRPPRRRPLVADSTNSQAVGVMPCPTRP